MDQLHPNLHHIVTDNSFGDLTHKYIPIDGKITEPESIANRATIKEATGATELCFLGQTHGNQIYYAESEEEIGKEQPVDAAYTDKAGLMLCIRTADCVPVILYADDGKLIGAAHAGWRGAKTKILYNLFDAMSKKANNISALIGPAIIQKSYEVNQEFHRNFIDDNVEYEKFFVPSNKKGHFLFNLPTFVKSQLLDLGISNIIAITEDTYSTKLPDGSYKYTSYRRHCHIKDDYPKSILTGIMITP